MNKPIKKNSPVPATEKVNSEQNRGRLTPVPKMELKPVIKSKNK